MMPARMLLTKQRATSSTKYSSYAGIYHLPVKRFSDRGGFDTRIVHPFATKHYRLPADAGNKTDDTDLDAIFRATIAGYGLIEQDLYESYANLRLFELPSSRSGQQTLDVVLPDARSHKAASSNTG
jgi:hypothetical protein